MVAITVNAEDVLALIDWDRKIVALRHLLFVADLFVLAFFFLERVGE